MQSNPKSRANNAISQAAGRNSKPAVSKEHPLIQAINQQLPAVEKLIFKHPEKFVRGVITTTKQNPKLLDCDPKSFLGAMMESAAFNLEPNTKRGLAYLIPYGNQVQFQLGYQGLIELAYRTGEVDSIKAITVYENEPFEYEEGIDPVLKHRPLPPRKRGNILGYYAILKKKNGSKDFYFAYVDEIQEEAKRTSKPYQKGTGPWTQHFSAMAKAWVIKRLLKYANLSEEVDYAISNDGSFTQYEQTGEEIEAHQIFNAPAEYEVEEEIIDVEEYPEGQQSFK